MVEAPVPGHQDQLRVAARHQETEDWKDWFLWQIGGVAEPVRIDMRLEVVDRDEWTVERVRHRLGGIHPDDQRPSEARSLSDCYGVEIVAIDSRLPQRLLDYRDDGRYMTSRRELGNHTAVAFMEFKLRRYDRRQNPAPARNYRGGRLIARRLDAEYDHGARPSGRSDSATVMSCPLG